MDFLIQFLQQKADATVISEPQLTIADNDLGKLFVARPFPSKLEASAPPPGNSTSIALPQCRPVIIEVEPHINGRTATSPSVRAESSTIERRNK